MATTTRRPSTTGTHQARRPIMTVLEWLGRRWTLRVLWELRDEVLPFRALQERCDAISPTVLNERLRELRQVGMVTVQPGGGYALTEEGRALGALLVPLHQWSETWARRQARRRAR
jgi:DNA-binding HxlR family transcriptional regulator